jgi:hypothetical protein
MGTLKHPSKRITGGFMDAQEMKAIFNANRSDYPQEQLTLTEN